MTVGQVKVWRASSAAGFCEAVLADPRHLRARKREYLVTIAFAPHDCMVDTREGPVQALAGDAIVTGIAGERWPVRADRVSAKYRPVPPGKDTYVSLPVEVLALQATGPFAVVLADGHSRIEGERGDYLVDYGDGSLGIVSAPIFAATYHIIEAN